MKNIILTLSLLLTLLIRSGYSESLLSTKDSSNTEWSEAEIALMVELIPILYKEALRLDSCEADAAILDSMNKSLTNIIYSYALSEASQKKVINKLNSVIGEKDIMLQRADNRVKLVKKKSFWNGFKWGSGVTGGFVLIILILLL